MKKLNALIKREIFEFYINRKTGILIILILAIVVVPFAMYGISPVLAREDYPIFLKELILSISFVFVSISLGTPLVIEQFYKDKSNLPVFFALGFSPLEVWLGKICVLGVVTYGLNLIALLPSLVMLKSMVLNFNTIILITLFILSVFIGVSLLGLQGILHFILKDVRLLNVIFILPFFLFFFSFKYFSVLLSTISSFWGTSTALLIILIIMGLISIFLNFSILKGLNPENLI